jgi:hypothetical protein
VSGKPGAENESVNKVSISVASSARPRMSWRARLSGLLGIEGGLLFLVLLGADGLFPVLVRRIFDGLLKDRWGIGILSYLLVPFVVLAAVAAMSALVVLTVTVPLGLLRGDPRGRALALGALVAATAVAVPLLTTRPGLALLLGALTEAGLLLAGQRTSDGGRRRSWPFRR